MLSIIAFSFRGSLEVLDYDLKLQFSCENLEIFVRFLCIAVSPCCTARRVLRARNMEMSPVLRTVKYDKRGEISEESRRNSVEKR